MKLRYLTPLLLATGLLLASPSCKTADSGPNTTTGGGTTVTPGSQTKHDIDFKAAAASKQINLGTDVTWQVQSSQSWCKASQVGRNLKIEVEANEDADVREAILTLSSSAGKRTITVHQLGQGPAILVDQSAFDQVSAAGAPLDFVITTNVDYEVKLPDWIKTPARALRREAVSYLVTPNKSAEARMANIEIVQKGVDKDPIKVLVAVKQLGFGSYVPGSTKELPSDEQVKVVSGTASSAETGHSQGIEKSFDGDLSTIYHSAWNNGAQNYFPITLTYNFAEPSDVDYILYHPRGDGNYNGYFKQVEIQYSEDGTSFQTLKTHDFEGSAAVGRVALDKTVRAKSFRFIVRSGAGDRQGFASCAEMEFYHKGAKSFDYKSIFADDVCSELKPTVTDQQIEQISDPFFRNLAFFIKGGKYDKEFRVADFKPWLHPEVMARHNKTFASSLLDNPTGIAVQAGEDLIVFVGDTHGIKQLTLRVQNLDKPGGDGFGDPVQYPLYPGMNRLKMQKPGLCYVLYHTKDKAALPTLKPIRMHFATGTVNGYYDSQNPKLKDRWQELLGKASNKYFDVLGKHCHLTFETQAFRSYTPEGRELTKTYDSIVYNEWILHGVLKYKREPQNRMYLHVMYHAFMYATWYHTAYVSGTQETILDPSKMRDPKSQGAAWGPAHEIGHTNQTRPGLLWHGMTEVTVNIPSEYITTYVFGQPSRLQAEKLGEYYDNNRYTKGFNAVLVPEAPFSKAGDVFCQLIPFWQLELYFGKTLGRTPRKQADGLSGFYPDLYEYLRNNPDLPTAGEQQTEFPFVASKIAGVDLTPFFERWGFFRPVNMQINDYGDAQMTVTADRAAQVKARIAALKLPKLDVALEYITDHNSYLYKDKTIIEGGNAAQISRVENGKWAGQGKVSITGWKGVVAFEVYDRDKLLFAADATYPKEGAAEFILPFSWQKDYTIKAVSAANTRVAVPKQ